MTVYTPSSLFSLTRASGRELGAGVDEAGRAASLPLTGGSSFAHRGPWPWLVPRLWRGVKSGWAVSAGGQGQ